MESEKTESTDKKIFLQLGQIIQISAPSNGKIHDKKFLIEYLDENIMKLINNDDYSILELTINNGIISDESIENITLLPPHPKEKGYAKLWGYLPGKWFSFHFGGNFYKVIHGQITNLEKDQIEIRTVYPKEETIYIDFAYKGIPLNLPLIKIVPFDPNLEKTDEVSEEDIEEEYLPQFDDDGDEIEKFVDFDDVKKEIQSQILDLKDLDLEGVEEREMTDEREIEDHLKRFSLDSQVSDLLESLLSNIDTNKRTNFVLNNVHKEIERFKELRILHSYFNEKGYVSKIKKFMDETTFESIYKPLIQNIKHMDKLLWVLPIVKTKKLIYDIGDMDTGDYKDILKTTFAQMMTEEIERYAEYKKSNISEEENKYRFYYKSIQPYYNPSVKLNDLNEILVRKRVVKNMESIVDNFNDFYSDNFGITCKSKFTKSIPKPQLRNDQYIMNKSITGLTHFHLYDVKKFNYIGERREMTPNDTMHIKGYMFLPNQVREYSRLHLKQTNIMKRTSLNQHPLQYWKIFSSKNVNKNSYFVSAERVREHQYLYPRTDLNNIHSYKYSATIKYSDRKYSSLEKEPDYFFTDVSYENRDNFTIDEEENNFLNSIVSSTDELLNVMQEKIKFDVINRTKYGMSIYKVLEFLEPYGIYNFNISDENYSRMSKYCNENIEWYKKSLNKNILEYQNYVASNKKNHLNSIYNIVKNVNKSYEEVINSAYGMTEMDDNFYSNIIELDNGELFMNIISLINIELSQNIDIEKTVSELVEESEKTVKDLEDDSKKDDCQKFVLAKRYVDIEELKNDNETDIYFDKKYDDTRYGIMDVFKADKDVLTAAELLKKIKIHLINNVGVDVKNAERDALAILEKKKIVVDGDYAILDIGDFDYKYYDMPRGIIHRVFLHQRMQEK